MGDDGKIKVLLEMRPALDGYAGIPQETRLLFRGLCTTDSIAVEGLLQTAHRFLPSGTSTGCPTPSESSNASNLHHYSRIIIALETKPSGKPLDVAVRYLKKQLTAYSLTLFSLLMPDKRTVKLTRFESHLFKDFIWRTMFEKTLPASDFEAVTNHDYRVCPVPWNILQSAGLNSLLFSSKPVYPLFDTQGADIFIAQTPYPARVAGNTTLVVRYHDALPVLMPHTIAHKSRHQATHYYALMSNVQSGAYFACVSEATRQDLLRMFPEVEGRSATIHNMVSHHYFDEPSPPEEIGQIIRARLNLQSADAHPNFATHRDQEDFYMQHVHTCPIKYLLIVSTIEPRKNHTRLIAAWRDVRSQKDPSLKLIIVGNLGWDTEPILREMRPWIDQGQIFLLHNVPADELRKLYHNAAATVCPSLGEGFDFSGIEAMRSGGVVISSDIPVHREVYANAAEYFDPYSTEDLAAAITKVLFSPDSRSICEGLRSHGNEVSSRYLPERVLPQWTTFLKQVSGDGLSDFARKDTI